MQITLASDFTGTELLFLAPPFLIAAIGGGIARALRNQPIARGCGVICAFFGALMLFYAIAQTGPGFRSQQARKDDAIWGVSAVGVAAILFLTPKKVKR